MGGVTFRKRGGSEGLDFGEPLIFPIGGQKIFERNEKLHYHSIKYNYSNPLSANPTKWSNTLKQFVGKSRRNCLRVLGHFVGLALKGLICFKGVHMN